MLKPSARTMIGMDVGPFVTGNSTCVNSSLDQMIDVTLSVLVTLKLSTVGIIYDNSAATQVYAITRRLSSSAVNLVTYAADDVVAANTDVMGTYLNMITTLPAETISLIITGNLSLTAAVFQSFSRYKTRMGKQSGLEHFTKWLTVLVCPQQVRGLENEVADLYNVAAVLPHLHIEEGETLADTEILTLIIKPDGRRFERVGLSLHGDLHLHSTVFPNLHRGFNGRHFMIGLYVWYPFTMRKETKSGITYVGFCVDLVTELSRRLNFTFSMTEPADNNWGSIMPDGNWTGVVGMLQKFEIDISVAALIITLERETVMDASFPFYYDNVGVLYKRPDPLKSLWKTYFHPFKLEVFLSLAGSFVLGAIIYVFLGVASPFNPHDIRGPKKKRRIVISEADHQAAYLMSSLIQHGHPSLPRFASGRFFISFWWAFAMIIAAIYKGNLTAFLLVPMDDVPFRTLAELANQDVYKWGVTGSTVVEYLFKVSKRPEFKKMGEGLERFKATDPETDSLDPLVHLRKVKAGQYAYISDMVPMEIWVADNCDLRILKETVIPLPFVVGFQNNSAYLSVFNQQLLDIDQMGLYSVWRDRWWPKGSSCGTDEQHRMKVLSLLETQSAFYILCAGIGLGLLSLLSESIWKSARCGSLKGYIRKFWCS